MRYVHIEELLRVMMRTLRVIHPSHLLLGILGRPRRRVEPAVQTRPDIGHLLVQLGPLVRRPGEHVLVDAEDSLVDAGLDALELDDVDKGLDVGPGLGLGGRRVLVGEVPELEAWVGKLEDVSVFMRLVDIRAE